MLSIWQLRLECSAVVSQHRYTPSTLISRLHHRDILVKVFAMFIADCTKVFWKEVQMGVEEMNFQRHVTAQMSISTNATWAWQAWHEPIDICAVANVIIHLKVLNKISTSVASGRAVWLSLYLVQANEILSDVNRAIQLDLILMPGPAQGHKGQHN